MYKVVLPLYFLLISVPGGNLRAEVLYENGLPKLFLNGDGQAPRSGISFTQSDPLNEFEGFVAAFSHLPLAGNIVPLNSTITSLVFKVNSNLRNQEVAIRREVTAYQSTDPVARDAYYPLWQSGFGNLNLVLSNGIGHQFAEWGANSNPAPTTLYSYWLNHYSNTFLSGAREEKKSGEYLRCTANDPSAPCYVEDSDVDQAWDNGANLNLIIDGSAAVTPKPSTSVLPLVAILALASFLKNQEASSHTRAYQS